MLRKSQPLADTVACAAPRTKAASRWTRQLGPALLVAVGAVLPSPAPATQATLFAVQDSPIYGPDGGLAGVDFATHSNGAGYTLYVGTNGTGSPRRSLLQFDFSSLPPGATVTSATLLLTLDREPNANNQLLSLHVVTTAWTTGASNSDTSGSPGQGAPARAGDATWYYASWPDSSHPDGSIWQNPGGDFSTTVVASTWVGPLGTNGAPLTYTWTGTGLAASINAWIQQPSTNHGWILIGNEVQTQSVKRFMSRETLDSNGTAMNATFLPHLDLTYEISSGTSTGGGTTTTPTYTPGPWGVQRRRIGQSRPKPCCN